MKKFKLYHLFYKPFYSREFYLDVAANWKGLGYLGLFCVIAVILIPYTAKICYEVRSFMKKDFAPLIDQFPPIHIKDGVLSIEGETPCIIRDLESNKAIIVIDPTDSEDYLSQDEVKVFVTSSSIHFKKSDYEVRSYDLSQIKEFSMSRDDIHRWIGYGLSYLPIIYFFILPISYLYHIIQTLLYALIGMLFAKVSKVELGYDSLVRLSVSAIVPVMVLDLIQDLTEFQLSGWWFICFLIAMAYLFIGVEANKKKDEEFPSQQAEGQP